MLKKGWDFIKENVAAIVTVVTAILTVVYAALRLCMYVYWKGYFTRLNIDVSIMDLNFDNSIFAVIFVSIVLFVVLFFMAWVHEIISDIKKKAKERRIKGIKKILYRMRDLGKGALLSIILLSIINLPLIMLLVSVAGIGSTISNVGALFLLLYIMEMLFIFTQLMTTNKGEKKEKSKESAIALKVIEVLTFVLIILVTAFYAGNKAIDEKMHVQLLEKEEYMISYCDGERYVLHKVEYNAEEIVIHKNEQKIVDIVDCEVSIRQVKTVKVID